MKKKQLLHLIEYLDIDDDDEIYFSYDYGDHSHHVCVVPIENLDNLRCRHSDYTDSLVVDNEYESRSDESKEVWVIS
jgi:hypothetical protein